ncbi:hypothetical protein NDA01_19590 [Trichocoleus desertorum AS-A10]|uniref:hypothetical protein n=1 Tax=Trichocoleus desertorum TaxID=1481672 RepID=UPI003296FBB5
MAQKIILTCFQPPSDLPLGYQFCEGSDLIACELREGETSREALARARDVGLTVVGWSMPILNRKL